MEQLNPGGEREETLVIPEVSAEGVEKALDIVVKKIVQLKQTNDHIWDAPDWASPEPELLKKRDDITAELDQLTAILDHIMPNGEDYWAKLAVDKADKLWDEMKAPERALEEERLRARKAEYDRIVAARQESPDTEKA